MKPTLLFSLCVAVCAAHKPCIGQNHPTQNGPVPEPALILSQYISRASVTGNEKEAGEFFAGVCRSKGLHVQVFSDGIASYNFAASLYPLSLQKPNIVFLNHIDVVPAGDTTAWRYPPFSGTIAEDMVWGRGAIDLKGLAVMQLMALSAFADQAGRYDLPYNVTILCVSQEEATAELGTQQVLEEHFADLNAEVVFGEGGAGLTGLISTRPQQQVFCVSTSEKQALWLRLSLVMPKSGHGSVPPATYANKAMVAALSRLMEKKQPIQLIDANTSMFELLGELEKGYKGVVMKNIRFFKPVMAGVLRSDPKIMSVVSNTIALTSISNPEGSPNQIAQEVTATLDCRLLPGTDYEKFIAKIQRSLRTKDITISVELSTVNANGSETGNEFYQNFAGALRSVYPGAQVVPYMFPAYTDNNYFRNFGIPVYGIKPVMLTDELLASIHNVDERLPISSLLDGTEVYIDFLNRILNQQPIASLEKSRGRK